MVLVPMPLSLADEFIIFVGSAILSYVSVTITVSIDKTISKEYIRKFPFSRDVDSKNSSVSTCNDGNVSSLAITEIKQRELNRFSVG